MRRRLSDEERDLWRRMVRNVAPLPGRRREPEPALPPRRVSPAPAAGVRSPERRFVAEPQHARAPHDVFAAGDPKMERHARRGRIDIDATFDLHGHNQASARATLYGFLLEARRRGHRCVLVVTGKGERVSGEARRGGVLRAGFRRWINEDDFRQHVVRASQAHQRHGGAGAFYVFLKTR